MDALKRPCNNRLIAFDLDHTLLTCNSSFAFGCFLFQRGLCPWWNMVSLLSCYATHKVGLLSMSRLHRIIFALFFRGKSKQDFCCYAELFLDLSLNEILFFPVYQKLLDAQSAGDTVVLFSSGPDFLVNAFARRLKIDRSLATTYAVNELGLFSEVTHIVSGKEKACALRDMADSLSFKSSTAYSDSYLDVPFLAAASNAVVVRPDRSLRKLSLLRGWSIIN